MWKNHGGSLYAFLTSLLLHAGIFLAFLSLTTGEVHRGDFFFIRLITLADLTGTGNSAGETFVSPAVKKKELFQSQRKSEIAIKDKHSGSETLLNELNIAEQENLDSAHSFPAESPDRTVPSNAVVVTGSEEKTPLPQSPLRGDRKGLSGEVLSGLNTPEGPSILELIRPLYPSLARRLGKEGSVLLKLYIDEQGRAVEVEIIKRAGYGFDEAALNAIKQSRFRPPMKNGIPVPSVVILPVRFVLEA